MAGMSWRRGAPAGPVGPERGAGGAAQVRIQGHLCPAGRRGAQADPDPWLGPGRLRTLLPRVLVTGGPSAGTTTFVNAMTSADSPAGGAAVDIGRVGFVHGPLPELWLVGSPGTRHYWPLWNMLRRDLIGAVVLVDVRRLADCFGALDYLIHHRVPYVVASNPSGPAPAHPTPEVRNALAIGPGVPVIHGDPRQRSHALGILVCLVEHALGTAAASSP